MKTNLEFCWVSLSFLFIRSISCRNIVQKCADFTAFDSWNYIHINSNCIGVHAKIDNRFGSKWKCIKKIDEKNGYVTRCTESVLWASDTFGRHWNILFQCGLIEWDDENEPLWTGKREEERNAYVKCLWLQMDWKETQLLPFFRRNLSPLRISCCDSFRFPNKFINSHTILEKKNIEKNIFEIFAMP